MAEVPGVNAADSPTEGMQVQEPDVNAQSSSAQAVNADSATDRPEQNWQREFQRKVDRQQQQLDQVLAYLVAGQQQTQRTEPKGPVTDEELWAQAQQGDRVAFEEYQRRIAAKVVAQDAQVTRRQQMVRGQLQALVAKYPVLQNPAHPLAQTMNQAYQLLLGAGYAPGEETLVEAAKTAIADRPDLVAEHYTQSSQAREQVRQDSTRRAQSGAMGGTIRTAPRANANAVPSVSEAEQSLAQRMGVKDPAGAMKRFRERQAKGQSSFGAVAAFIPDQEG